MRELAHIAEETYKLMLGRELNAEELRAVADNLPGALDWIGSVESAIRGSQATGKIGPSIEEHEQGDRAS